MLKIAGIVLIVGSFTGIAVSQRQQFQRRVTALNDMLSMLDYLSGELAYRLTDVPTMVEQLAQDSRASVAELFGQLLALLRRDDQLSLSFKWMKAFRECGPRIGLKEEDIAILCDLSDFIGKYDVQSQQKSIDYARGRLRGQLSVATSELKSKGSVYRTCCIAAGILLVLVLI